VVAGTVKEGICRIVLVLFFSATSAAATLSSSCKGGVLQQTALIASSFVLFSTALPEVVEE
jgi:hypothetical protein